MKIKIKNFLRIILLVFFVGNVGVVVGADHVTNPSANWDDGRYWVDNDSWVGDAPDPIDLNQDSIDIGNDNHDEHYVTRNGNIVAKNNIVIHIYKNSTLKVTGDVTVQNNLEVIVDDGGKFIVDGDINMQNNATLTVDGDLSAKSITEDGGNNSTIEGDGNIYTEEETNVDTEDFEGTIVDDGGASFDLPAPYNFFAVRINDTQVDLEWGFDFTEVYIDSNLDNDKEEFTINGANYVFVGFQVFRNVERPRHSDDILADANIVGHLEDEENVDYNINTFENNDYATYTDEDTELEVVEYPLYYVRAVYQKTVGDNEAPLYKYSTIAELDDWSLVTIDWEKPAEFTATEEPFEEEQLIRVKLEWGFKFEEVYDDAKYTQPTDFVIVNEEEEEVIYNFAGFEIFRTLTPPLDRDRDRIYNYTYGEPDIIEFIDDGLSKDDEPIYRIRAVYKNNAKNEVYYYSEDVQQSEPLGPLPIELYEFSAKPNQSSVTINWITAAEINNDFFTIERSLDGSNWSIIGYVTGAGDSNRMLHYEYIDNNPVEGIMYYRLIQTDYDGQYEVFDPIVVNFTQKNNNQNIRVYNNMDILYMSNNCVQNYEIVIHNIQGQLLHRGTLKQNSVFSKRFNDNLIIISIIKTNEIKTFKLIMK